MDGFFKTGFSFVVYECELYLQSPRATVNIRFACIGFPFDFAIFVNLRNGSQGKRKIFSTIS